MFDLLRDATLKVVACLALLILIGFTHPAYGQTQDSMPNTPAEKWIVMKIANGEEARLEEAFRRSEDRRVRGAFIQQLLTNSFAGLKVGRRGVHISDAVVTDQINLRNEEIPFTFSLANCIFEGNVIFRNALIRGDINAEKSRFKQAADFQDVKLEGDAFFTAAVFEGYTTFFRAHVTRYLAFDNSQFTNTQNVVTFENGYVAMNAFFRNVVFKGPVDFQNISVDKNIFFDGTAFEGYANFFSAEIKKDFAAVRAQFRNPNEDANLFGVKTGGNVVFINSFFAGGLHLAKADIGGNLDLTNVNASNPKREKRLTGLKADVIIFDGASFAPPYWLNGMSYRVISYNLDDAALLAFIGNSGYKPDVYSTLEAYYQRAGDAYAARDVYVAGKDRERSGTFSKVPLRYVWLSVQDLTTGYGKFLVRALLWALLFVIVGCIFFWREDGMETQDADEAEKYKGRYHPIWYSLATFLPIVDLPDAKIWTPKIDRRFARFYLRLHIIFGYLLIPIGLAAWTGIIK